MCTVNVIIIRIPIWVQNKHRTEPRVWTLNIAGASALRKLTDVGESFCELTFMPRSHWAFSASPMHSQWKLTSIRRCSGGITEPSANNLNSWYSWGSISPMPKIFNACFEMFHEPLAMFCREKCSANIRR